MTIKVWDYLKEYAEEKDEIHSAMEEVLNSGRLILGDKVKLFEENFSAYCNVKYGIGVDNGTNALFLGLRALGIGEGDEVITVSNTAVPTISAIASSGAKPVFVDVQEDTYLMNTEQIESAVTGKTKCILPVHLFGQCVNMDEVNSIAEKYGLKVLEDSAQAHGSLFKGRKAGSMSDLSATSFYPTKILGTFGDAGMVLTNNEDIYNKMMRLRFYGMEKTYYAMEHGYNSRLDELHAAILLKKLQHLEKYIFRRRQLADQYDQLLCDTDLILPKSEPYKRHVYYLYVVRHPKRDVILEELKKQDIHLNISYPWPIHTMTGYQYLGYEEGDLPVTEKVAKQIFSLPMYPSLSNQEQLIVVDTLHHILNSI
jgi:dTDP-3-amino-2,3,6-trideoxy-4-keto-D-glucose/dTDP-3-amino-3,4,6-trideoxy-alpha-D-glucose/dTDP-2,6-dideoxy-D-kanosamine transaminase